MKQVLAIRFSSMGDVTILAPVLQAAAESNDLYQITFLTKKKQLPIVTPIPNLRTVPLELSQKGDNIFVLIKVFFYLYTLIKPDIVLDLHGSIRSRILSFLFMILGSKIYKINKGKNEKRKLTRKGKKKLKTLKTTLNRYRDVFLEAKLNVPQNNIRPFIFNNNNKKRPNHLGKIGIAPFAKYEQKTYQPNQMNEIIQSLSKKKTEIYLLGGMEHKAVLEQFVSKQNIFNVAGKYNLSEEMELISTFNVMLSMDSFNMHLAAWVGVPVFSVWGATHPFLGFQPFHQTDPNFIIQNEHISCRPCSVYGNKKCFKKEIDCLNTITSQWVVKKIENFLNK